MRKFRLIIVTIFSSFTKSKDIDLFVFLKSFEVLTIKISYRAKLYICRLYGNIVNYLPLLSTTHTKTPKHHCTLMLLLPNNPNNRNIIRKSAKKQHHNGHFIMPFVYFFSPDTNVTYMFTKDRNRNFNRNASQHGSLHFRVHVILLCINFCTHKNLNNVND